MCLKRLPGALPPRECTARLARIRKYLVEIVQGIGTLKIAEY